MGYCLNIPDSVTIVAVTPLGYPKKFPLQPARMPLDSVIHKNGWERKTYHIPGVGLADVTR